MDSASQIEKCTSLNSSVSGSALVSTQAKLVALQLQVEQQNALIHRLLAARTAMGSSGVATGQPAGTEQIHFEVIDDFPGGAERLGPKAEDTEMPGAQIELQVALAKARLRAEGPLVREAVATQVLGDAHVVSQSGEVDLEVCAKDFVCQGPAALPYGSQSVEPVAARTLEVMELVSSKVAVRGGQADFIDVSTDVVEHVSSCLAETGD